MAQPFLVMRFTRASSQVNGCGTDFGTWTLLTAEIITNPSPTSENLPTGHYRLPTPRALPLPIRAPEMRTSLTVVEELSGYPL